MTSTALLEQILRLPAAERLRLVEAIWDSLAHSPERIPVPDWHRAELERRLADGAEQARVSWKDVQGQLAATQT